MTFCLLIGMAISIASADTYNLTTGETVMGELLLSSANDLGIQVKLGEGEYKRLSWSSLAQEDLKKLSANPKLQQYVDPFIEISQEERRKKTEVNPVPPTRLERPAKQSLIVAMFSSSLGIVVFLILYAANIYAGYEVALYRAKPVPLVCGVSAVLPVIGPLIFLARPTEVRSTKESAEDPSAETSAESPAPAAPGAPAQPGTPVEGASAAGDDLNPMRAEGADHPTSLHLHHEEHAKKKVPAATIYQRGQYTFNRRFFETRFAGFFGLMRKEADKDMVLVFKTARGEYIGERISRIASNDLHLQIRKGAATEEIVIPFGEVQEVKHKHKDA